MRSVVFGVRVVQFIPSSPGFPRGERKFSLGLFCRRALVLCRLTPLSRAPLRPRIQGHGVSAPPTPPPRFDRFQKTNSIRLPAPLWNLGSVRLGMNSHHREGFLRLECYLFRATPSHKWEFHFTAPSKSQVDSNQGNTPTVLGIVALCRRDNMFVYQETLLKRNVALEILTCDLAWSIHLRFQAPRKQMEIKGG